MQALKNTFVRLNWSQKIILLYVGLLFVFWLLLYVSGLQTSSWNYFYSFAFSLIPFVGGLVSLYNAKKWGWLSSAMGKAIFFIGLGLFSWGSGSMVWSYYNFFLDVAAPYPSVADLGFIMSIPFWIVGIANLARATGAKFGLRSASGKLSAIIVPILAMIFSYYLLVVVARGGVISDDFTNSLKLILDFGYPLGDVVILTLAVLIFGLSYNFFGGRYKFPILMTILGFVMMYFADFIFSYTTTVESFYNGNIGDLIFTIALSLLTCGNLGFSVTSDDK